MCAVALVVLPFDFRQALVNTLIGIVMALSLVVITGFVGQISVVQLTLAGVAGFVISHLAVNAGIGFPLAPLAGVVAAVMLGSGHRRLRAARARGEPGRGHAGRGRRDHELRFFNTTLGRGPDRLAGARAEAPRARPRDASAVPRTRRQHPEPGLRLGRARDHAWAVPDGRLRSDAAGSAGACSRCAPTSAPPRRPAIDPRNVKLIAFGISAVIAGVAGSLYAYNFGSVSADRFDVFTALSLIAFAYAGGITLISGAVFAGLISTQALFPYALDKWFGINGNWFLLFGGVILIITLIQNPEGVIGAFYKKTHKRDPLYTRRSRDSPMSWASLRAASVGPRRASCPARSGRSLPVLTVRGPVRRLRRRPRAAATSTSRSARASWSA